MAEKGEAEFLILAEGTSVHTLAGRRWWKGLPSLVLHIIHAGSVGPSCHPVKVHQRSGTPRFLLSSATQACHFSLARSLGCLALFQGQKRRVSGLKAGREYWVVVHCSLYLGEVSTWGLGKIG